MVRPVFVVDWDGVCTEAKWPEWGDWLPGAVEALKRLRELGEVRISSARLNPYKFGLDGRERRSPFEVGEDIQKMRDILDSAGLVDVKIHTTTGKPSGTYYIDDRAIEFKGSWDDVIERVEIDLAQTRPSLPRHPGSDRFHEILRELGDLHDRKQADYGTSVDPFANVRSTADWGIPAWVGALVRLNDKVQRLKSMVSKGSLNNESAEDSMRDIAVYAAIALVLYEEELSGAA